MNHQANSTRATKCRALPTLFALGLGLVALDCECRSG
ncbi:MAG: hypothetical protein RLZZ450_5832 [Pseudomonadota bacterium]|jgi:hypothetical protein